MVAKTKRDHHPLPQPRGRGRDSRLVSQAHVQKNGLEFEGGGPGRANCRPKLKRGVESLYSDERHKKGEEDAVGGDQ